MKMTFGKRAIDKIYRRRDRYDIPDWQRDKGLWDLQKKQNLIDSILRGWKLPKFYFVKISNDPEEFEVVDGQQRLTTIFEFFDNELQLSDESSKRYGGKYYNDLPQSVCDNFDDYEIEFDIIEDSKESDLKLFFQRLQDGLPLTSSEKLNSLHSKLRDFTKELSNHSFFKHKVYVNNKRFAHFDIVAKVAAIEIEGLETGLRYDDIKAIFESQVNFSPESTVAKRLKAIFDFLDKVFPEKNQILKNRTVIQAFATFISRLIKTGKSDGHEKEILDFFSMFIHELSKQVELGPKATDSDLVNFQKTINANIRSAAQTRHEIILRKMLIYSPSLIELFDPTIVAESGLKAQINNLSESVVRQINILNNAYAAKNGNDLIKPTSKTSFAMATLGKPINNFEDYKSFIDHLYFLFHEGVGSRLNDNTPVSFKDVSTLRTDLQHDLDHGTFSKVRAKRKNAGNTFKKYSGTTTSPYTLAPDQFLIIQANLLAALNSDIRLLESTILIETN